LHTSQEQQGAWLPEDVGAPCTTTNTVDSILKDISEFPRPFRIVVRSMNQSTHSSLPDYVL